MNNDDQIQEIPLSKIYLDRDTQIRATVSEETIQRYYDVMEDEKGRDKFPPILLILDAEGNYWLADGHHRVMAAIRRKFTSIFAMVRSGTKADAIWEAAKANGRNALQMGRSDIRRAVELIVAAWPNRSNVVIAEVLGCNEKTVRKYRPKPSTSDESEVEKRVGKDGKTRSVKRSAKPTVAATSKITAPPLKESAETKSPLNEEKSEPQSSVSAQQAAATDSDKTPAKQDSLSTGTNTESHSQRLIRHWLPFRKDHEKGARFDKSVHVPLGNADMLIACLFEHSNTSYREGVLDTLIRAMLANDGNESVLKVIAPNGTVKFEVIASR